MTDRLRGGNPRGLAKVWGDWQAEIGHGRGFVRAAVVMYPRHSV